MKVYNAKIIVDNDRFNIIFECDKEKNNKCKGYGNCRECNFTTDSRYAKALDINVNREELDDTIEEITTTTIYAGGKPIKMITETKYKCDNEAE